MGFDSGSNTMLAEAENIYGLNYRLFEILKTPKAGKRVEPIWKNPKLELLEDANDSVYRHYWEAYFESEA